MTMMRWILILSQGRTRQLQREFEQRRVVVLTACLCQFQSRSNSSGSGGVNPAFSQSIKMLRWVSLEHCHRLSLTRYADITADLTKILDLMNIASTVKARVVKDAIFEGEELVFSRLHDHERLPVTENAEDILVQLSSNLFDPTHQDEIEALRLKRAKAVVALARISQGRPRLTGFLERSIASARDVERSDSVRKVLDQAASTLPRASS